MTRPRHGGPRTLRSSEASLSVFWKTAGFFFPVVSLPGLLRVQVPADSYSLLRGREILFVCLSQAQQYGTSRRARAVAPLFRLRAEFFFANDSNLISHECPD
jgi:hypothetical protein